jgi:putative ABC transport system permease protein
MAEVRMLRTLANDLRFALRQAARRPAVTAVALLTIALGIGANAAIFSVVQHVVLRPLPFPEPARLAAIWPGRAVSNAELVFMQRESRAFASVAAFSPGWGVAMTGAGDPRQLNAARISSNYFQTLGVTPIAGSGFSPDASEPGKWNVAVISAALWRDQFGSDRGVLGRVVDMDGQPTRIIGVMGGELAAYHPDVDAWLPLQIDASSPFYTGATALAVGRLRSGATLAQATAELAALAPRMRAQFNFPNDYAKGATVVDLHESIVGAVRQTMFVLLGAVVLLVTLAAVNVGNLQLVQAVGRAREFSVRRALGASAGRLTAQLLVESLMLAVGGGLLGLALGAAALRALVAILPGTLPFLSTVRIDAGVVTFCAAVTVIAGLSFAIAPIVLSTRRAGPSLRDGMGARGGRGATRARELLVVVEIAVAMTLVVGATLMTESMRRLARVDLGYDPANVLTMRIQPSSGQVRDAAGAGAYFDALRQRLAALPGVKGVGGVQHLPLTGFNWHGAVDIDRRPTAAGQTKPNATWRSIVGDYFATMKIPVLRGRAFTSSDTRDAPPVVIINEAMAKHLWPGDDPVGQRIKVGNGTRNDWATIVGVVGDVRFSSPDAPATDEVYRPNGQQGLVFMHFVIRTDGDPLTHAGDVRNAVRSLDTTVPIADVRALADLTATANATRRTIAQLLSAFALLGLVLGTIGVYGVVSFGVAQRTRELGIRSALGARQEHLLAMVLGAGLRMALGGILVGALVAGVASRSLSALVFGISTTSPGVFVLVACTLGLVAALSSALPAWRAARVDPLLALKGE